jgi:hypothetical protein
LRRRTQSPNVGFRSCFRNLSGRVQRKAQEYQDLEVLYYSVYIPDILKKDHELLEVYRWTEGQYVLMSGEPFWMPEIGLGIGRAISNNLDWRREWLYWFSEDGERYPVPEEYERYRADLAEEREEQERQRANQAEHQAQQERQWADVLAERLRALGLIQILYEYCSPRTGHAKRSCTILCFGELLWPSKCPTRKRLRPYPLKLQLWEVLFLIYSLINGQGRTLEFFLSLVHKFRYPDVSKLLTDSRLILEYRGLLHLRVNT